MDGENNGSKPYEQMDDLGGVQKPLFLVQHPYTGFFWGGPNIFSVPGVWMSIR